jgi:hypothetical protein
MTMYASWRDVPADAWRWPNFAAREMACRGTGRLLVQPDALDKLQALRNRLGVPLIVISAYRSPEHNAAVGGARRSQHMEGVAFDISMANHNPSAFIAAARAEGFTGIGTYPRSGFVHIDTGPVRSWGDPFPQGDTNLPIEAPRRPETLREDRDAQVVGGVAGVSGALALTEALTREDGALLDRLASIDPIVLLVVVAAGYLIWRHRSGRPL